MIDYFSLINEYYQPGTLTYRIFTIHAVLVTNKALQIGRHLHLSDDELTFIGYYGGAGGGALPGLTGAGARAAAQADLGRQPAGGPEGAEVADVEIMDSTTVVVTLDSPKQRCTIHTAPQRLPFVSALYTSALGNLG